MSHRSITILAAGAALAALAPASAALARSAPAPASGSGVPAGKIELTIRSVHITGSHAVPRYERTRQYLTADESHTITTTVPQHKLRFEGFTSPRRDLRYDAATKRVTLLKGSATPPYQTVAQEAAVFARQVAQGCWTPAGNLVFEGRGSTRYNLVRRDVRPLPRGGGGRPGDRRPADRRGPQARGRPGGRVVQGGRRPVAVPDAGADAAHAGLPEVRLARRGTLAGKRRPELLGHPPIPASSRAPPGASPRSPGRRRASG